MSGDELGRETQLLQQHECFPPKYLWTSKRNPPKRKDSLLHPVPLKWRSEIFSWTSGTLTVVHPVVEAFVCACKRMYAWMSLFLLAKLHFKNCNLEGLNVSRGRDAASSQKIITSQTKHRSRVTEENQCLQDQGPTNTKGSIQVDPRDTPSLSRLKHTYVRVGGLGPKLFTMLCHHEEGNNGDFYFIFFHSQKRSLLQGKKTNYTWFLSWIFAKAGL